MCRPEFFLALTALLCLPGCPTDDCEGVTDQIVLADANNYDYVGSLEIQGYPTAELVDITIDWSGVDTDLQGHPLDPATEIDLVTVVVFRYLSQEEIEEGLSTNSLDQVDVALLVFTQVTGQTSVQLSELTMLGTDIDVETYFEASYGTWLVTLSTGSTPGVGTRQAAFLEPTAGETNTTVMLANDSAVVHVSADMVSLTPVLVPPETALHVDWSGLTIDGTGNDIALGDIDQVMIGHYTDLTTTDVQSQLLDLELIADGLWQIELETEETEIDLSAAAGDEPFTGVAAGGTWILALRCSSCPNPAPPFLTVLTPCS